MNKKLRFPNWLLSCKMSDHQLPLIVITGPTASGKTSLAIELAEQFGGEIISADSRTIYRGMDIGTAKPSASDRRRVPHWGLDLVEPGERFTAADFKQYADQKIEQIRGRGRVPFLVGGTGLYIDAVIFDFQFAKTDLQLRAELEKLDLQQLRGYCKRHNIPQPENNHNKRHLVRYIERAGTTEQSAKQIIPDTIVVGIATEKSVLRERIRVRTEQIFNAGVIKEAMSLASEYGWDSEAMTGNVYRLVRRYADGDLTEQELKQKVNISDWHLAKRQMTWLKRNPYIKWGSLDETRDYIKNVLS